MSANDFNGRLFEPVIALPLLPLSSNASTDSCSILFSFRTIMSGALSSKSLFNRLFLLITRRYRSFKSEVANLPPSKGTSGLRSGGSTGRASSIIHSGLFPDPKNASNSFSRFEYFLIFVSDLVFGISLLIVAISSSMLISPNRACIASAPIIATNSSPNSSNASKYSSSVKSCPFSKVVNPGSVTT